MKGWNWYVLGFSWKWGKMVSLFNLRQEFSRWQRPNPCAVGIGRGQRKLLISLQHLHLQNAEVVVPIPRDALHLRVIELKQRPDVETNHAVQQTLRRLGDAVNRHHGNHQEARHIQQKNKQPKIKTDFRKERIQKKQEITWDDSTGGIWCPSFQTGCTHNWPHLHKISFFRISSFQNDLKTCQTKSWWLKPRQTKSWWLRPRQTKSWWLKPC